MTDASELIAPLSSVVHGYLARCVPGRTTREIFALAVSPETRVQAMVPVLWRNPLYVHMIESIDMLRPRMKQWEEEEKGNARAAEVVFDRTVSLLQKTAIRNIAASIQVNRCAGTGLPRKKGDKIAIVGGDAIPRALAAEEDCVVHGLPGADQAFLAGYHYDLLAAALSDKKTPKDAREALSKAWKEGRKAAQIAAGIVSTLKTFDYHSSVVAGALLAPAGKALMAIAFPKDLGDRSWSAFVNQCDKLGDRRDVGAWLREPKSFPITHGEMSSLLVSFVGFFEPIERAIAFYRYPERLKSGKRGMYRLAGVISAANRLAVLMPNDKARAVLNATQLGVLKDCGFNFENLPRIIGKVAEAAGKGG